jgi:xanthine dehydrogenase accessory factor
VRELRNLIAAFDALGHSGSAVLATVVEVEGSTYRRAGARALLLPEGDAVGLIGGGCLEGDLAERAREVRASGAAIRLRYDHRGEDDVIWGLGVGCAGRVDVLLQPVSRGRPGPIDTLRESLGAPGARTLATVIAREGDAAPELGACVDLSRAERDALLERGHARTRWRGGEAHRIQIFEEIVAPPPEILVFGAGPDALPVVRLAAALGYTVRVVDPRPALARADRFAEAAEVLCCAPEEAGGKLAVTASCVALLMTHHYLHDLGFLRFLLGTPVPYVGVLGPKRRTDDLLRDLRDDGGLPEDASERVHGPAGLDLGAEAPDEIALALLSEIQAARAGRRGGPLRERKGPIHDPVP